MSQAAMSWRGVRADTYLLATVASLLLLSRAKKALLIPSLF
jgi:hypothetical protein